MNKERFEKILPHKNFDDFTPHPNGGGLVEKTANVAGTAYIGPDALVYDNALVYEFARIYDNAQVYEFAGICGYVRVFGDARVYGDAEVYEYAQIGGNAQVCGDSTVYGYACLITGKITSNCIWFYLGRHALTLQGDGSVKIGCKCMSIDEWIERYKEIGKSEGYSKEEIKIYGYILKKIKAGKIKY